MPTVQQKRGLHANLPSSGMLEGEMFLTTDRQTAHFAKDPTTLAALVPDVEALSSMGAVAGAADLLMIVDASQATLKARKITVDAFKTALNIPAASTDELVAVISGGTSGYIWGTDGTDGILRMNASMQMTKDAGNAFVTLAVGAVDCGTF